MGSKPKEKKDMTTNASIKAFEARRDVLAKRICDAHQFTTDEAKVRALGPVCDDILEFKAELVNCSSDERAFIRKIDSYGRFDLKDSLALMGGSYESDRGTIETSKSTSVDAASVNRKDPNFLANSDNRKLLEPYTYFDHAGIKSEINHLKKSKVEGAKEQAEALIKAYNMLMSCSETTVTSVTIKPKK